jgi:hypothetical protein
MKKFLITVILALAVTAAVSAQAYVVQEVNGRAERNTGGTRWTAIAAGETLTPDTVIRTQIGANVVIKRGNEILTIGPLKNGALSTLIESMPVQATTDENSPGVRPSTPTARKKASDAAAEVDLTE